jgi:hypothetical protein
MDEYVRVPPDTRIGTKQRYRGPVEVTAVARTEQYNIRLYAFNGACVIFNWEHNPQELRVTRPDGNDRPESGSLATARVQPLRPNTWYRLRWRITESGMAVFVNDERVFVEKHTNNLSAWRPIYLFAGSRADVKSFTVKSLSGTGPAQTPNTDWRDGIELGDVKPVDGFVRIRPYTSVATRRRYWGPVEVTAVARTEKDNIRLHAFGGACVIFNWEGNPRELRVHRPDGSLATARVQPLRPNSWYTLRWRITESGMEVFVNGRSVFAERRNNYLFESRPIRIQAMASPVDVKSLTVKPLAE